MKLSRIVLMRLRKKFWSLIGHKEVRKYRTYVPVSFPVPTLHLKRQTDHVYIIIIPPYQILISRQKEYRNILWIYNRLEIQFTLTNNTKFLIKKTFCYQEKLKAGRQQLFLDFVSQYSWNIYQFNKFRNFSRLSIMLWRRENLSIINNRFIDTLNKCVFRMLSNTYRVNAFKYFWVLNTPLS